MCPLSPVCWRVTLFVDCVQAATPPPTQDRGGVSLTPAVTSGVTRVSIARRSVLCVGLLVRLDLCILLHCVIGPLYQYGITIREASVLTFFFIFLWYVPCSL